MKASVAQLAPVWMDRKATVAKAAAVVAEAGRAGSGLIAFGEAVVPGYPIWLEKTGGAEFDSAYQKKVHALYVDQAVVVPPAGESCEAMGGHLKPLGEAAADTGCCVIVGVVERALDRGGHSLYCSRVMIGGAGASAGKVLSVHRKLMPTYEERLCWSVGDGAGLVVHEVGGFAVGALNCWENWLPLARAALHAQGENVHAMIWPGARRNTELLTRSVAFEGRSYVLSASGLLRPSDVPAGFPGRDRLVHGVADGDFYCDGGSCIAGPDGEWLVEPQVGEEGVYSAELDLAVVRGERQNLDISGHYSRPDVLQLVVNRERQRV
ncbi:MAG: carbon-nitrogen hydrolase family protein [Planctomycetota bacterium]